MNPPNKVVIVSYGDFRVDGRLRALDHLFQNFGIVKVIAQTTALKSGEHHLFLPHGTARFTVKNYARFTVHVWTQLLRLRRADWLVVDDMYACLPVLAILPFLKRKVLIQDCRELYLRDEMKTVRAKVVNWAERTMLRKSAIVLCAGFERAQIMEATYNLPELPLVFENIRALPSDPSKKPEFDAKYSGVFRENSVKVIATGGFSADRRTLDVVRGVAAIPGHASLFIAGSGSEDSRQETEAAALREGVDLTFLGLLQPAELAYVLQQCDIGVVSYHRRNANNEFCASGKVYEYLDAGLPLATTANPPLANFCTESGLGVADDDLSRGLRSVASELDAFRSRVKAWKSSGGMPELSTGFLRQLRARADRS